MTFPHMTFRQQTKRHFLQRTVVAVAQLDEGVTSGRRGLIVIFLKGPFQASFLIFVFSMLVTVNKCSPMTGFDRGPLVSEATTLPTEPQLLP